jgi:FAD/FMN-containing dehydrogenase
MAIDIPSVARGEAGFDQRIKSMLFNKLPFDRVPGLVVTPRTEAEVAEVVRQASGGGHRIAVLSGGHSWIGAPLRDGGVLIDMSAFDRIEVDVDARTARVGPAVRSGTLAKALAAQGLAYPSGHCGTPAFGGYVLGGGLGLNWGQWRPACYSLRSVRVVTAAGELVTAGESENRDLLWLARGSGPLFPGVVVDCEIDLQQRPADTRVSSWHFSLDHLDEVSRWVSDISPELPAGVEVATAVLGPDRHELPPAAGFPDQVITVIAIAFAHDGEEARAAVAPMEAGAGVPVLGHGDLEPVPFELLHEAFDADYPDDHRYLADSFWTDLDVGAALPLLEETFRRAPSGKSNVMALMPGNGAKLGLSTEDGAYSMDARTLVMPYAVWQDPAADAANRAWIAEMSALLEPISSGHFISEADLDAYPNRLARCFTPASWERLLRLRERWDPQGLFHGGLGRL